MDASLGTPIESERLAQATSSALDLLRRTYRTADSPNTGGWYHQLDMAPPGPTATAVALLMFKLGGASFDRIGAGLAFLKSRQIESADTQINGGWSTNTSFGMPVMEATGWVVRFLALSDAIFDEEGPDIARGLRWIEGNQNHDGGWGSLLHAPSRTWTTCLALRALAHLTPRSQVVERGVNWLMESQNADFSGWGETRGARSTVTHTSFVLLTLNELRASPHDARLISAYDWLAANVNASQLDDDDARVEAYNVSVATTEGERKWQTILPHYCLPLALSALLLFPERAPSSKVILATSTILERQHQSGCWPNIQGGEAPSIWAIAGFIPALADLSSRPLAGPRDNILWSDRAVVIQRENSKDEPLAALIRAQRRAAVNSVIARYWATILVSICAIAGVILLAFGNLGLKDYLLSLILPVALFILQEARQSIASRRRKAS